MSTTKIEYKMVNYYCESVCSNVSISSTYKILIRATGDEIDRVRSRFGCNQKERCPIVSTHYESSISFDMLKCVHNRTNKIGNF